MTPEMHDAISKALQFQRGAIADGSHALAHGFLYAPDGKVNVYAFDDHFFSTWQEKNKISALMLAELFKHGGVYAFVCEGWHSTLPEGVRREALPSDMGAWPAEYRSECLMCCCNAVGHKGVFIEQPFTRRANGKPHFGKILWEREDLMHNRFAFDLTDPNLEHLRTEAMMRGRNGVSTIQ
jgi:hypothetical protein